MLFKGPMVRAILDGSKTQTRRVITRRNSFYDGSPAIAARWSELDWASSEIFVDGGPSPAGNPGPYLHVPKPCEGTRHRIYPRVQPEDRLWVRETFAIEHAVEHDQKPPHSDGRPTEHPDDEDGPAWRQAHYRATDPAPSLCYDEDDEDRGPRVKWKSPIHMPRKWSRITLEVTGVRVERLQDISEGDAIAEGIDGEALHRAQGFAPLAYRRLWGSINGADSWESDPFVWVVEFKSIGA